MDWVPRSVRFKQREIEKALADLESMLKRQPTESELAGRLGISRTELHQVLTQISFVSVLALDETVNVGQDRGESVSLIDTLADKAFDPSTGMESQETRGLLAAAINSLSEREKIVVTLYYFEGPTLAEIGEILGVTESRVCQIHTTAVASADGTVTFAGPVGGYLFLTIDHGGGLSSTYSWLSAKLVRKGDRVLQGQPIAFTGWGHPGAPIPHLHLGVKLDGAYADPLSYLGPVSLAAFVRLAPFD